jgi:hypothetical protein
MPLNVNGYNNTFSAFVEFANANGAENGKHGDSIARLGNEVMIEDSDIAALI